MWKSLSKKLHKELLHAHKRVFESRQKVDLEKRRIRLNYEKVQLIKQHKSYAHINDQLKMLKDSTSNYKSHDTSKVRELMEKSNDVNNLKNVVRYLQSRRTYDELLERYNPGLTMSQKQNIQKSANMVGLKVPE